MSGSKFILKISVLCCLCAGLALSQGRPGNITGQVIDPSGAPVPNAKVEATNVDTGHNVETDSDSNGNYRFERLPHGRYRVSASTGQVSSSADPVDISTEAASGVQVRMRTADAAASPISVETTSAPAGERDTAQISKSFSTRRVEYLTQPNFIGRDGTAFGAYNLGLLPAGVVAAGGPVVSGQAPSSNNFHIDGIDNNNGIFTGPLVYISNEATAEFSLFQNKKAGNEFGHAIGGQFNSVVRTGTNRVHGSIYNYLQNRMLNAMDRRYIPFGLRDNPRYDQNRLGASIGTPIIPNVAFFYGNFEYIPLGFAGARGDLVTFAPTAAGYGVLNNTAGLSRQNLGLLSQYLGSAPGQSQTLRIGNSGVGFGPVLSNRRNWQNQYVGTGAIDWNFGSIDSLHFRYVHNEREANFSGASLAAFQTPVNSRSLLASISHYHTFGAAVTNELRAGYTRLDHRTGTQDGAVVPMISIAPDVNLNFGNNSGLVNNAAVNTYHLADNVGVMVGGHNLRFGFDGRRYLSTLSGFPASSGMYSYSSLERFLRDLPPDVQSQRAFNASPFNGNQWSLFGYVNDRFNAARGLTIDLSLGYQYLTVPQSARNQSMNANASVPGVLEFNEPKAQQWNFTPKIGVAYAPGALRGTTFRGGFGIVRDAMSNNLYYLPTVPQLGSVVYGDLASNTPGFLARGGLSAPTQSGDLTAAQARAQTTFFSPDQRLPYSYQWNAGIQQELWRGIVLEAKYLGSRTLDIPIQTRLNSVARVTVERSLPVYYLVPSFNTLDLLPVSYENIQVGQANPLAQYGFTSPITSFVNDGQATYHGLAVEARTRFAGGTQLLGSYTWSHLIDNVAYGTVQDAANRDADRADSIFDRRHRAVVTGLFEPSALFGNNGIMRNVVTNLAIGGTYSYQSPQRVSAMSGFDTNLDGDGLSDRALINSGGLTGTGSDVTALTDRSGRLVGYVANNPAAGFVRSPAGVFVNAPRSTMRLGQINNFDVFAVKRFLFRERFGAEVRGDAYNVFNHAQYTTDPITQLYPNPMNSMATMMIPGTANFNNMQGIFGARPRVLQVALRLTF